MTTSPFSLYLKELQCFLAHVQVLSRFKTSIVEEISSPSFSFSFCCDVKLESLEKKFSLFTMSVSYDW